MSRKRDDGAGPPAWGQDRVLRPLGEQLVDADDRTIEAHAKAIGADPRRLRAFVLDARRRRNLTPKG